MVVVGKQIHRKESIVGTYRCGQMKMYLPRKILDTDVGQ